MQTILLDYLPAELRENKEWYVRYYVKNPITKLLHLKKIKINRIKSITERRRYGRKLVSELNIKLEGGWNPFTEQEAPKAFVNIYDAFDSFMKVKTKEMEEQSLKSYKSNLNILKAFLMKKKGKDMYVISMTKRLANDFLNYMYIERNVAERRYNGMLNFCKALFYWLLQHDYIKSNPFVGLKKKKEKQKKRKIIPQPVRSEIKEFLQKTDVEFLVNILIQYHSLLRPNETLQIRVKDINLEKQTIFVSEDIAKNDNTRIATIPNVLVDYIKLLKLENYDQEMFIFSDKLRPGTNVKKTKLLGYRWRVMRKKLGFNEDYQMYSLRDTGIVQMLDDGISIAEVAKQADHHSLEITSKYALHANVQANEVVKEKSSTF